MFKVVLEDMELIFETVEEAEEYLIMVYVKIEEQLIHLTEFGNIMYMGQKGNGYPRKKKNFLSI